MINVLNSAIERKEAKEVSFLSPNWEMTSQSGKNLIDVLKDIDESTEVLRVAPQNLLLVSITRRCQNGVKTVTINPMDVNPEDIITSSEKLDEEVMRKDDLEKVGVDESALAESFMEGHFFVSVQDDCLLVPNKGFTALVCKKLKIGKMPSGLSLARDLYLSSLMAVGSTPITIIARGKKNTGTLKAVGAFGENYPFVYQRDMYEVLKGNLEHTFGHILTEKSWCVTHQFTSIVWAVCPCDGITFGVCGQWSQTGYAATQLFPVAIYATGEIEKIGRSVSRPNTGSAVAADPDLQKLVAAFGAIWKEEIAPLGEALSRAKGIQVASFKEAVVKAAPFVTIRDELNVKKKAKFMDAFLAVPDRPASFYDVLMHVLEAPVLMHRLFSGTYEMVTAIASAALAVAEEREDVL